MALGVQGVSLLASSSKLVSEVMMMFKARSEDPGQRTDVSRMAHSASKGAALLMVLFAGEDLKNYQWMLETSLITGPMTWMFDEPCKISPYGSMLTVIDVAVLSWAQLSNCGSTNQFNKKFNDLLQDEPVKTASILSLIRRCDDSFLGSLWLFEQASLAPDYL